MKKLLIDIPQLTPAHRAAISEAAARRGFAALFCEGPQALAEAADAEILFAADPALPGAAPRLKWLCVPSAGVEPYLSPELYASPEAVLTNSSGAYGAAMAEHVVMAALELMRRQAEYDEIVAGRGWRRDLPIRSLLGSRIALLGTGDVGRTAARRLRGFEPASITGVNRSGRNPGEFDRVLPVSRLDEALPEADLLVMALPGTPGTAGLMDARRLALLPEGAYLINVGRGSALDEAALAAMLRDGRLAGAALDVFRTEPLPPDDPLWGCPRLRITPHTAGNMALEYTVGRIVDLFLEDFENYCEGRPLRRRVDREKGY